MTAVPTFNLNASNINFESDEELQSAVASSGGNYLEDTGNYDLVISAAGLHTHKGNGLTTCPGDDSWLGYMLTLTAANGKSVNHYVAVPTTSLEYGTKKTLMMFRKLQDLFIGLGEVVTIAKVQGLLEKYFTDPAKLIGLKVNADLGYDGPYVANAPDSTEFVVLVKGAPMKDGGVEARFLDKGAASQFAASHNLKTSRLGVLKFTAKKPVKVSKAASTDW